MTLPHDADALDNASHSVLAHYSALLWHGGAVVSLGNRGGFSGARLWRVQGAVSPLCLRAWPETETLERLQTRHVLMTTARAAGLAFVPAVFQSAAGSRAVAHAGRLWELAEWLPGQADYRDHPSPAKLTAACTALAQLHAAWEQYAEPALALAPGVRRRLDWFQEWHDLLRSGWRPLVPAGFDAAATSIKRSMYLLSLHLPGVPERLRSWREHRFFLRPCLCDVWHDHLLFEGERLTGLIDYGAVKVDQVAVDLARMLGSLVEDDAEGWRLGLAAYRKVRALTADEEALARDLDVTGTLLGVVTWLRWLCAERKPLDRAAGLRRLEVLLRRIERWTSG
jgi:Ser/Thr protein kinase RdoA (MazF antagonist)